MPVPFINFGVRAVPKEKRGLVITNGNPSGVLDRDNRELNCFQGGCRPANFRVVPLNDAIINLNWGVIIFLLPGLSPEARCIGSGSGPVP